MMYTCGSCRHEIPKGAERWVKVVLDTGPADEARHPECMSGSHYVAQAGERVSPYFKHENQAFEWLLGHQGQSVDWAMRYEGYSFEVAE